MKMTVGQMAEEILLVTGDCKSLPKHSKSLPEMRGSIRTMFAENPTEDALRSALKTPLFVVDASGRYSLDSEQRADRLARELDECDLTAGANV